MNLNVSSKSFHPSGYSVKQLPIQCQGAVIIQHEMGNLQIYTARYFNNYHWSVLFLYTGDNRRIVGYIKLMVSDIYDPGSFEHGSDLFSGV